MSDYILVGVVAAVAAALHRAVLLWVYRSWFRQGFVGDAAFHLTLIGQLKSKSTYTGIDDFLIIGEPDAYPIFFHRLMAKLFSYDVIVRRPYLPNAVLWVVLTSGAAIYFHYISVNNLGMTGPWPALAFTALFLTLASNLSVDMNGLNYLSLSERMLARFVSASFFLAIWSALKFGDDVSYGVALVSAVLAAVTSLFSRQTVAFVGVLVAIMLLDIRPLLVVFGAVVISVVIQRDFFVRGIRHMFRFAEAYNKHTKHSRYYRLGLSQYVNWKLVFGRGASARQRLTELETREPTRTIFRYPELYLYLVLGAFGAAARDPVLITIIAATFIVYLMTSTQRLRHLGEANRYIEYALWLVVPAGLAFELLQPSAATLALLLLYGLWLLVVTARNHLVWRGFGFPERDELSEFLAPLKIQPRETLFCVPMTLASAIRARVPCRALMWQGSSWNIALHDKYIEELPFLKRDWRSLSREHQVSWIIVERSSEGLTSSLLNWSYDFSELAKVAESPRYSAYAVTPEVLGTAAFNQTYSG